ncbi:hypothetical protein SPFM15_00078 [Salmonella phage SPFM15]|nr:hypothetical protein SPFM5_00073 [Salmonella phage SPFM5]VFR13702.1 hypothetical protein SPFM15_00078 [Salmonella phage SPFM15]
MLVIGAIVAHLIRLINILYWMEKRYSHNIPMITVRPSGLTTFYLILGCVFVNFVLEYAVVPNQPFFEAEA